MSSLSLAPAVLFGLVVWLQLHNRNLSILNALLMFLFTMFFVQTGIGHAVSDWVGAVLGTDGGAHEHLVPHQVPSVPPVPSRGLNPL